MDFIFWLLSYVVPFLVVLTIIVFVHEMGHYLVARWNGIAIQTFSLGFGPELVGFNDRHGTRWRLSAIPLGGYVRFVGDMNASSVPDDAFIAKAGPDLAPRLFVNKNVWQRMAVVVAGPLANVLLTFAILYGTAVLWDRTVLSPVVGSVRVWTPAYAAGIRPGDKVLSIDGYAVHGFEDISRFVATSPERQVAVVIERGGEKRTILATPERTTVRDMFGVAHRIGRLGMTSQRDPEILTYRADPVVALGDTVQEMRFVVDRTAAYIGDVFVGRGDLDQLGGPVKVAQLTGQVVRSNPLDLIGLVALLSLNIGLVNLLPIPMLDGGHLLYYIAEALRGRPLPQRVQDIGYRFGLAVVLCLMVFATLNDTILSYLRSLS